MKRKMVVLFTAFLLAAVMAFASSGCKNKKNKAVDITLDKLTLALEVGDAPAALKATVVNSTEDVVWTTSASGVAMVKAKAGDSKEAVVTAVAKGKTTITAAVGDKSVTCAVTVTEPDAASVSIKLDKNMFTLRGAGAFNTLTATVANSTADVVWTTGNAGAATVQANSGDSKQATVTAVAVGSATITAAVEGKFAYCEVTVVDVDAPVKYFDVPTEFNLDVDYPFDVDGMLFSLRMLFGSSKVVFDTQGGYYMESGWGSVAASMAPSGIDTNEPIIKTGPYEIDLNAETLTWTYDDQEYTMKLVFLEDDCMMYIFPFMEFPFEYYTSHEPDNYLIHFPSYYPYPQEILGELDAYSGETFFNWDSVVANEYWEGLNNAKFTFTEKGAYTYVAWGFTGEEITKTDIGAGAYKLIRNGENKVTGVWLLPNGSDAPADYDIIEFIDPDEQDCSSYVFLYDGGVFYLDVNMIGKWSPDVLFTGITVGGAYQTEYFTGDEFDDTGIVVTAKYSDGSSVNVPLNECDITFDGGFNTAGTVKVTITYNGESASFYVTVEQLAVTGLGIGGSYKTNYFAGESFDGAGLIITAEYNNDTDAVVPLTECDITFEGSFDAAGTVTVKVSYEGQEISFNVTVTAVVVNSITIGGTYKTNYYAGQSFDGTGINVTAHYNNGTTASNIPTSEYNVSFTGSFDAAGTVRVTITFGGKTAYFDVTVNALVVDSISLGGVYKTNYIAGELFDGAGIVVTAHYNSGATAVIQLTECGVTFDGSFDAAGTVKVTIQYGGKTAYFDATVADKVPELSSIAVGGTYKTEYTLGYDTEFVGTGVVVTAYYSNTGTSQQISLGECSVSFSAGFDALGVITVTVTYGGFSDTFTVEVVAPVSVTGISLNQTSYYVISRSSTFQFIATVYPLNATNQKIVWSSSVTGVASIDQTGKITTGSTATNGETIITARTEDGNFVATCTVRAAQTRLTGVNFGSVSTLELFFGAVGGVSSTGTLTSAVAPTSGTGRYTNGVWASSDPTVASVTNAGDSVAAGAQTITALKVGTTTITFTTIDGGFVASCVVTVLPFVPAATVTLSETTLSLGSGGSTVTLTASVLPSNTTNKNVVWSSGNEAIATVDQTGKITPLTVGTTTIRATSVDGVYGECTVEVTAPVAVTGISIDQSAMRLNVYVMTRGTTYTPTAIISPSNASNKNIVWTITTLSGLSVNASTGALTATSNMSAGQATVTATTADGSFTDSFIIRVSQNRTSGANFGSTTTMNLYIGAFEDVGLTGTLTPTVAGTATGLYTNGYWTSSDPTVATVTNAGVNVALGVQTITALKAGTTTITYTTIDNGYVASCTVTVAAFTPATSVALDKAYLLLGAEVETYTLAATVSPSETTNKKVIWSSSNPTVATVDQNGKVSPLTAGTAYIRATSVDGAGIYGECEVEVFAAIKVTGITLDKNEHVMGRSQTFQLTATVAPGDATNKKFVWSVTSATGVTIDQNGLLTTSSSATYGSVTVTATTDDGSFKATCLVYVAQTRLTGANFGSTTTMTLRTGAVGNVGSTGTLTSAIAPTSGSNRYTNGIWASSDPTVATVSNAGVSVAAGAQTITALKVGTTTITFTTIDVGFVASCVVTVLDFIPAATVTLNKTTLELKAGIQSETLTVTVGPSDTTNKTVIWSSSNPAIAEVDQSGKVTAIAVGTATIKATSVDGAGIYDECVVTVLEAVRVTGVEINGYTNGQNVFLLRSATLQLTANILPSNADLKTVTWSSIMVVGGGSKGTTNVVTVSSSGLVTADGSNNGSSIIAVTTVDGEFAAMITVYVVQYRVTGVSLNQTDVTLNDANNFKQALTLTWAPTNATIKDVIWTSSNPAVAKVDAATNTLLATGIGTATITAKSLDGGFVTNACNVTVENTFIPVTSVTLTVTTLNQMTGDRITFAELPTLLGISVLPSNATNTRIIWSSTGVLFWDEDKQYISLSEGGVGQIIATAEGGNCFAVCNVTVSWLPYDAEKMGGKPGNWFSSKVVMSGSLLGISFVYEFYDSGSVILYQSGVLQTSGFYTIWDNNGTTTMDFYQFNDFSTKSGPLGTNSSGKYTWNHSSTNFTQTN